MAKDISKQYFGVKFVRGDSCSEYRKKRKDLFRFLKLNYDGQTLYTYLAVFDNMSGDFSLITAELVKKEGVFLSFEDFMNKWHTPKNVICNKKGIPMIKIMFG